MSFDASHVMNALLERGFRESRHDLSPMKAQKMLFFTHGWHLAITGEPAINKAFEVWPYGPVVSSIYQNLKVFGSNNVNRYISEYDPATKKNVAYVVNRNCTLLYDSIDIVWEKYVGISAVQLSAMTHEADSPWDQAKRANLVEIPNQVIQEYFVGLARGK